MIRKALSLLLTLVALLSAACSQQTATTEEKKEQPRVLRVGLIPNQAPDKIKAKYEPFRKYLEEKLGLPVELFVATNYAGVVEAMAADKLELAYFGGLTYVQAKQKAKIHPIVTEIDSETKTTKYYSLIITQASSPIKTLQDLKGKTFAFGDINSTSGSLYPRIMLDRAGLKVPDDFANIIYTGKHDATALAVQNGKVDAGGLEGRILNKLIEDGKIDRAKIRILAKSDPIEGYPWCVQDSLDPQLEAKIVDAFLSIKDPELLKLLRAEGFARVKAEDYAYVEQEARRLGLLKQ